MITAAITLMATQHDVIASLQAKGFRVTRVRQALVDILARAPAPLSANHILQALRRKHLPCNKTTVYREIDFLLQQGLVRSVAFGTDTKYIELVLGDHHHHLRCLKCSAVSDIELDEAVHAIERLARKKKFMIQDHSLEFFGLCHNCQ